MGCDKSSVQSLVIHVSSWDPIFQNILMLAALIIPAFLGIFLYLIGYSKFKAKVSFYFQKTILGLCFAAIIGTVGTILIETSSFFGSTGLCSTLDGFFLIAKSVAYSGILTLAIIIMISYFSNVLFGSLEPYQEWLDSFDGEFEEYNVKARRFSGSRLEFTYESTMYTLQERIPIYSSTFSAAYDVSLEGCDSEYSRSQWVSIVKPGYKKFLIKNSFVILFSLLASSMYWLKFLLHRMGLNQINLKLEIFGMSIPYEGVLGKFSDFHSRYSAYMDEIVWLPSWTTFAIDFFAPIIFIIFFMWQFGITRFRVND